MRLLPLLMLPWLLVVSSPALARPRPHQTRKAAAAQAPRQTRFLGKDPHGPLAVVKEQAVRSPSRSACRTWAREGSVWHALGPLGQLVGKARVDGMERYDVTNCDELVMKTVEGEEGVGLFVSDGYRPAELTAVQPAGSSLRSLQVIVQQRDRGLPRVRTSNSGLNPGPVVPLDRRMIAWKSPDGTEFAAVGGRALSVLRREGSTWKVLHTETPGPGQVALEDMYLPVAVLDMNADGQIEIVAHVRYIDAYEDITLTPTPDGYRLVQAGIHGAFA